jgi:hypothetical protein
MLPKSSAPTSGRPGLLELPEEVIGSVSFVMAGVLSSLVPSGPAPAAKELSGRFGWSAEYCRVKVVQVRYVRFRSVGKRRGIERSRWRSSVRRHARSSRRISSLLRKRSSRCSRGQERASDEEAVVVHYERSVQFVEEKTNDWGEGRQAASPKLW